MTHRFFIPPNWFDPPAVRLHGEIARQIRTVLRMQPGDEIIVLDNSGVEWRVRLTEVGQTSIQGQIVNRQPAQGEPSLYLTLYQGTLKGQKFEWVLQKGTELGVSCFVPTICQRSIVRDRKALAKKYSRWQQIIREAAEQSGRGKLPHLEPALSLPEALRQARAHGLGVMPWEAAGGATTLKTALAGANLDNLALFIGPEGGLTADEAVLAQETGFKLVKLGPRILRAETAGLAVCAAIFYEMDEWH